MNKLSQILTKHKGNVLLLMRLQQNKLWNAIPLFIEMASEQELKEAMQETLVQESNEFSKDFEDCELVHNRVMSHDTAERIRYGFLQYCILNKIDIITYNIFEKFAKQYNVQEEIIIVYDADEYEEFDQNTTLEELLLECTDDNIKPRQTNTFEQIAQLTTDLAVDQNPREFKDFVKFINKNGKEIKSKAYHDNQLTMYEREVIQNLFGFDTIFFSI